MELHLSPELLDAFLTGTSGAERATTIETHIDGCEECRVLLSNLVRSRRDGAIGETQQVVGAWLPVAEGETIAGKYRVEKVLGSGGMGVVMAAWHLQLNQRVALKFMQPGLAADGQSAMRFQREARAAARLQTMHVGKVLDLDSLPSGTPFVVMEFLDGEGLDRRLAREKTIPVPAALEWVRQGLTALAEAHAAGIVHRDVKPGNLFLARRPDGTELVKVLDFGIAKSIDPEIEHGLSSTSSRLMLGSPPYMPPEQFTPGSAIDARADVWAMGVVLYQLVSGRLPFDSENLVDVMYAIRHKPHRPLIEVAPFAPAAVIAIVDRCLTKDQSARFADALAMGKAIEAAQRPVAIAAPIVTAEVIRATAPGVGVVRPLPLRWLAGVALAIAAVAIVAVWRPWADDARPVLVPPPPSQLQVEPSIEEAAVVPAPPPPVAAPAPARKNPARPPLRKATTEGREFEERR